MDNDRGTETTTRARAGSTPHIVRYVLAISLVLAIIALASAVIFGWGWPEGL